MGYNSEDGISNVNVAISQTLEESGESSGRPPASRRVDFSSKLKRPDRTNQMKQNGECTAVTCPYHFVNFRT